MSFWIRFLSFILSLAAAGSVILGAAPASFGTAAPDCPPDYSERAEQLQSAIVSVHVFFHNDQDKDVLKAACTGFFYDAEGHILTSSSVLIPFFGMNRRLNPGISIKVLLPGEKAFRGAELVHVVERPDLAVLKVDLQEKEPSFIKIEEQAANGVGQAVFALAYPSREGKKAGFAPGYITEAGTRNLGEDLLPSRLITSSCTFPLSYTGAPVMDAEGRFAGIVTALTDREFTDLSGYYYAADEILEVLKLLRRGRTEIRVSFGAYFLSEEDYAPLREIYGFPAGVYVSDVLRDGSAYTAKIKEGDIIVSINGDRVHSPEELAELLKTARQGAEWKIRVFHTEDVRTEDLVLYLQDNHVGKYRAW